jgi:hypothetical protein
MTKKTKTTKTLYADVASWELSDSLWERIEPLLPKPKSRYRARRHGHDDHRPDRRRRLRSTGAGAVLGRDLPAHSRDVAGQPGHAGEAGEQVDMQPLTSLSLSASGRTEIDALLQSA